MALRTLLIPPLVLGLASLHACYEAGVDHQDTDAPPETDADTDADTGALNGDSATVAEICDTLFELCSDAWGWSDFQACEDGWLGQDQDWACADTDGYLACTSDCLAVEDCEAFGACEPPCWEAYCL